MSVHDDSNNKDGVTPPPPPPMRERSSGDGPKRLHRPRPTPQTAPSQEKPVAPPVQSHMPSSEPRPANVRVTTSNVEEFVGISEDMNIEDITFLEDGKEGVEKISREIIVESGMSDKNLSHNSQAAVTPPPASLSEIKIETEPEERLDIITLLNYVVEKGASDLHLSVNAPPLVRIDGNITPIPGWERMTAKSLKEALFSIIHEEQKDVFEETHELDFAYTVSSGARFRGNMMRQRGFVDAVFRVIPQDIKPLSALGMPPILGNFAVMPRGLVLITGPTGSGKSTTLAAIIDQVNRTRQGNIITIEDPIEFVHKHRSCVVRQREVGSDTNSYTVALKHVLRQDPDVILIGEMRDLETISIALTAAETGHLVFATLHTQSAQDTVSRVIDVFPEGQQAQIRSQLAAVLRGVVCQTLVPRAGGKGRIAAVEIMLINPAVATMIRRNETHTIPQALQTGEGMGMQTLNMHLADLVSQGLIERVDADEVSNDIKDLDNLLKGVRGRRRSLQSGTTLSGVSV